MNNNILSRKKVFQTLSVLGTPVEIFDMFKQICSNGFLDPDESELPAPEKQAGIVKTHRSPYPEDWNYVYMEYALGHINAADGAELLGLSKNKFYYLVNRYKKERLLAGEDNKSDQNN